MRVFAYALLLVSLTARTVPAQAPVAPPAASTTAAATATAASADARDDDEDVDVFGMRVRQSERFRLSGEFVAGWSHDGAQAALGFEKQGRVGMAILSVSGRVTPSLRYFASLNPVSETSSRPSCGETNFFFPNDPRLYAGTGPRIDCDAENGTKRVDTYNTYSLDYLVQQGILREGYLDWTPSRAWSLRAGRFVLPIGLRPQDTGTSVSKDMPRVQRLNAEANFGAMLVSTVRNEEGRPVLEVGAAAVLGDGNREKDYNWFYFANPTLDSNSALTAVATLRVLPTRMVDLRASYKKGFTGSKVERLPSYWASKRHDDALVLSLRVTPTAWSSVFGEYARYTWGPTRTSAEMLGLPVEGPIGKPGYYTGAEVHAPLGQRIRVGVSGIREELSRDDSLVQYLSINQLYGVSMGKKDRQLILRGFVEVSRLVRLTVFWVDASTPFPWVSGMWPVAGPRAFTGRDPARLGVTVSLRTP